jgi:hypothetical protein
MHALHLFFLDYLIFDGQISSLLYDKIFCNILYIGRAIAQTVIRRLLTADNRLHTSSVHVLCVVDIVALGQGFL